MAFYLGDTLEGEQQKRVFDQHSYNALAQSLLEGRGYSFRANWYPFTPANTPTAHWSFVYPLFLAGVYAIFGIHPLMARIIQAILCGALSVWLIYQLGARLRGHAGGLVAASLGAFYAYFIFHDGTLMTESYSILCILASFDIGLKIVSEKNSKHSNLMLHWLLLGMVFGLSALLRQTVLLWLPFFLLWVYWAGRGKIRWWEPLISLGVLVAFILPWTIRNYRVYGAFLPLNSNAGYALYSANHPNHGIQFDQDYVAPLPGELEAQDLNEAQWNTALTLRGLQFIRDDPRRYLLLSLDRIPIFFNAWFSSESSLSSNLMRIFSFGLYLPFFIYGVILSFRDWRKYSLIYLFALVYSSMHILTWASVRYRLPVDAVMMPIAALAVIELATKIKTWLGVKGLNNTPTPLKPNSIKES